MKAAEARLLVANLDFESALTSRARGKPAARLSPLALRTSAALGTLMRALAHDGDTLWLGATVAPERMVGPSWLARPRLVSGPVEELVPHGSVLAWGESDLVTSVRSAPASPTSDDSTLEWLWRHPPNADAARLANHRGFALRCAEEMGVALPGASLVRSAAELDERIAKSAGRWVLKAPLSAAGRDRVLGTGSSPGDSICRQARSLLDHSGELLWEPWLERTLDLGCYALVGESECQVISVHRQEVDARGRFRAVELASDAASAPGVELSDSETMCDVAEQVAARLRTLGYCGPFGIDGWRWRDSSGGERLHPLGEVNARLGFGLIARLLFDRWIREEPGEAPPALRLVLGQRSSREGAICVLEPSPDDRAEAWLEVPTTR